MNLDEKQTGSAAPLRVAVIGTGVGGIVSAAECAQAGHEVVIYEAGPRIGGIWTKVNSTSTLQIASMLYRFHRSILWRTRYPARDMILGEIDRLWRAHGLEAHTRFDTPVTSVEPLPGRRWRLNGSEDYDAVICCVGTCHEPFVPDWEDEDRFQGERVHSSRLDSVDARGKRVVIVGSGASAIEAMEWAHDGGARDVALLSRHDRWVVPRHAAVNVALSMLPAVHPRAVRALMQTLVQRYHYRDLEMLVPDVPLYGVHDPCCSSGFLDAIREGRVTYLHGSPRRWTSDGLEVELIRAPHPRLVRASDWLRKRAGEVLSIPADLVVAATGFHPPPYDFLPAALRPERGRFLHGWIPGHPTLLFNNCGHQHGFGTAGGLHLSVFTRILLMFLRDPETLPSSEEMQRWVEHHGPPERLGFIVYGELMAALARFVLHPRRLRHVDGLLRADVLGAVLGGLWDWTRQVRR